MFRNVLAFLLALFVSSTLATWPAIAVGAEGDDGDGDQPLQLATDRPSAGDGSAIVPRNHLQFETGFNANFGEAGTHANLASTLFRFGLASFAEARLIASPVGITANSGSQAEVHPLTDVTLGAKFGTATGSDAAVAALPYVTVAGPTDNAAWSAGGKLVADIGTSQAVGMTFNLGGASVPDDGGRGLEIFASVSGGASLTERAGSFLEVYTIVPPGGQPQNFVDGGVTYQIGNRLQLDGWLGFEVEVDGARFVGVGASYLL